MLADPFYYLANFRELLATLVRRDGDLLAQEELNFIGEFHQLPTAAQALLVRMLMRKGPLFQARRLIYSEIAQLGQALEPLIALNWVSHAEAEVRQPRQLELWCETVQENVYRLNVGPRCDRLCGMFFGNFRQNLTDFVLADLGVFKYERAWMPARSRPFENRRQVEDFHRLHECREMFRDRADLSGIERVMPPPILDCEWLEERRQKLRYQMARSYERAGQLDRAIAIYGDCSHPDAQFRAKRLSEAASGFPKRKKPRAKCSVPIIEATIARPLPKRPVEVAVLEHLRSAAERSSVHYVENSLINSLFGLLCWPAVFAPVPGAFFHPFHRAPADFSSAGFFERRRGEFAACLDELRSGTYHETIVRHFAEKRGIASPFVAWALIDEPLLRTSLQCFPAAHLNVWFEWMVRDMRTHRAGFPDLVQFWPHSRRYRLIEVKGPGDRLQDNQRSWLEHMLAKHIPVSVCRVRWAGDGTKS